MRAPAIILKKIPIREYDELIICYTQNTGKQVYQAKSILRPTSKQAGHLDVLNLVDFSLVHKNSHPIITSAYCIDAFSQLKSSLPAMSVAYFLLECFDKLVFENEPDQKLWDFLVSQIKYYDEKAHMLTNLAHARFVSIDTMITAARQELLKILGYDPGMPIEHLANTQFKSLQFAREVLR
ncbi:MAG: DNA repair protein RecO [Candidatus Yanofskybacteria bacterium RIFCSPHIGHO2_01_FULL_44_17]|uniref:DNA repair protein RecO n=1 Tax=Candidatus Yanofskybacteria bacterium RIFCSPHIGHO2_01_FULL_44_17 TaxID=1802668 RepID=A0A1F8EUE9_9BACT|nr:MAG: DNA repair protein RecO [Candidatus Yanofskybacteria bacterium RIFCSPHIGHO2_01_FULL_44_17]